MAEKDNLDATGATPSQETLNVTGAAQRLLDRFPEDPSSGTEPDPEPTETEESEPSAETPESEDTDSGGLEDEPAETPEPPSLHKVQVDGVEMEITTEEALRGYSRHADYSKKTMQLADERRKAETEVQAARQARDAYAERLKLVDQALADEPTPDWVKVKAETPEDFPELYANWQLKNEERQKVRAERERVFKEQGDEAVQQQQVYLDGEAERLQEKIPEFAEPEKSGKIKADLMAYGVTQGFSRDEVAGVVDHRALVVLNKARKYDAIVARKAETKSQATTTPTVKPGGRPPTAKGAKGKKARADAIQRARESGSKADAAAAILHMD